MNLRDRRAIVIGAAVVLGTLLVTRLLPWSIRSIGMLRERAVERQETATRARRLLEAAPALRDSVGRAAGEIIALAPRLTEGNSPAEAQASLSSLVSLVANRQNLKLVRLDPLPDSTMGPFGRAAVQAQLEGDQRGLSGFLAAVEVGDPLLTVASLGVMAPEPVGRLNAPEVLRIEARIEGLYLRRDE